MGRASAPATRKCGVECLRPVLLLNVWRSSARCWYRLALPDAGARRACALLAGVCAPVARPITSPTRKQGVYGPDSRVHGLLGVMPGAAEAQTSAQLDGHKPRPCQLKDAREPPCIGQEMSAYPRPARRAPRGFPARPECISASIAPLAPTPALVASDEPQHAVARPGRR